MYHKTTLNTRSISIYIQIFVVNLIYIDITKENLFIIDIYSTIVKFWSFDTIEVRFNRKFCTPRVRFYLVAIYNKAYFAECVE